MILYHYITKGNTALSEGILSLAANPQADLSYYLNEAARKNAKFIRN